MKKKQLFLLLLLVFAVLYSCKKDNGGEEVQPEPEQEQPVEEETEIDFSVQGIEREEVFQFSGNEVGITELPDETTSTITYYDTQEDSLFFDQLALDVLQLNVPKSKSAESKNWVDDLADESIEQGECINIFSDEYEIEQVIWNCGTWGASNWGNFNCYFNTAERNGKKFLVVVLYKPKGFAKSGNAYLKLGNVNSGKVLVERPIAAGATYVTLPIRIELDAPGCLNVFPLVIGKNNYRSYLNPIMIKYKPIIATNWMKMDNTDDLFGTIDGVGVYCNGSGNIGSGGRQCIELCKRYLKTMHPELTRKLSDTWGDANQWPEKRKNDDKDVDKYIVLENNGENMVREGDIVVFKHSTYGHVAVVIKNAPDYIGIAHQNGAVGRYDYPIGTKLAKEGNYVTNYHPVTKSSPIYQGYNTITHFIRFNCKNEHSQPLKEPTPINLTCNLPVSSVTVGDRLTLTVKTATECKLEIWVGDWKKVSDGYVRSFNVNLPTSAATAGGRTVHIKAVSDEGLEEEAKVSYTVKEKPEPKTPVLSVSLSATSVEVGDNVRMTVSTDIDCDITYTISNVTKNYYSAVYLPTDAEGSYSVKVVATAKDGGKSASTTKYYTVSKKPENPVLTYSFSPSQTVDYNDGLTLRITADIYCDVYLKVDGRSYDSRSSTTRCNFTLPTNVAGRHTLEFYGIRDNGQSQTYNSYYYVNEEEVIVVDEPYVDLGLPSGTLWAKCNVGASNPWEYGGYYAWGETSTKADNAYTAANYKYNNSSKYSSDDKLYLSDDAAYVNMGSDWRMPTTDEWDELVSNCNGEWVINYDRTGVDGYIFRSKRYSDRFIFLPAAYLRSSSVTSGVGKKCNYWASNLVDDNAIVILLDSQNIVARSSARSCGLSVRAVKR